MAAHDNAYKNLFSHPQVVRDLLRGFVAEPWVDEIDFTTLEKASGSYVSDDLRDREDDIIWRIRHQGGVVYIYPLLDEAVITDLPDENAVSDIIDLESRPAPEAFEAILTRLRQRLSGDENRELRRAFTVWIHRVILPSLVSNEALPPVKDLEDVAMVIRERGRNWFEQGELRGEVRGLQKGAARTLLRQLELRFGKVPEDVRARIAEAHLETLLRWSEQVLTALAVSAPDPGGRSRLHLQTTCSMASRSCGRCR